MPAGYGDGVRWLMGEDAYSFGGAIRDMWSPECFGDPDRANSQSQRCEYHDNGGVHFGSGVPNHTFAMMVDGKEFNGQTVQGIGPIKAGAVWYRALAYYLTNGSDFRDTYFALNQAAADLIGTDPNDPRTGSPSGSTFTAQDATQVDNACRAAEMDTVGVCGKVVVLDPEPPLPCPGHTVVYSDDFETGATGWTVEHSGPGGDYDWTLTSTPLPHGRTGVAWYCNDLVTDCWLGPDGTALFSLISPEITLPDLFTHPAVAFTHFIQSEQFWDGGNVKIRVNGGQWQLLPPDAFYHNGYPQRPLFDAVAFDNTNPLAGQACFHGPDGTWGTSAAYIGNFVQPGDVIQIRFDFGKDVCTGDRGWYIDDVSVYDCTAANDCNGNTTPDEMEIAAGPQREVFLDRPPLRSGLVISDSNPSQGLSRFVWAPQMTLPRTSEITSITLWGVYVFSGVPSDEPFALRIHAPDGPFPGELVTSATPVVQTTPTGEFIGGAFEEYEVKLTLSPPITLPAGTYFLEIYKQSSGTQAAFAWEISEYLGAPDAALSNTAPGEYWNYEYFSVAILVEGSVRGEDVNGTGVPDECESCVNDADCSDGAYCNGAETCNSNLCWPSDTVPCTDKLCDEVNDRCVECFSDGDCDDGIFCNGKETCDDGSCDAPDESPCEAGELCDEDGDACVECLSDADCDDGDECTVDSCTSDVCSYREIPVCPDLDGDLVVDNQDACPNSPDGADVDARGCACSQLDGDGDGVNNCDDECPSTPRNAQVDALGCAIQTTTPIPPEDEEPIDEPPADDQPGDEQPDGGQGDEPEPEQPLGDVNRGQQRFSDNGCTACHNQQANRFATSGETVIYNTLIGALVHEGGDMPEMADQDLEDMTAYLTAVSRGERFLGPAPAGADSGEPQDPVPSQDDVSDADTGSGNVSRSSGGGSTCGVLGLTNLVFLMAGMALLRSTRRR